MTDIYHDKKNLSWRKNVKELAVKTHTYTRVGREKTKGQAKTKTERQCVLWELGVNKGKEKAWNREKWRQMVYAAISLKGLRMLKGSPIMDFWLGMADTICAVCLSVWTILLTSSWGFPCETDVGYTAPNDCKCVTYPWTGMLRSVLLCPITWGHPAWQRQCLSQQMAQSGKNQDNHATTGDGRAVSQLESWPHSCWPQ